VARWLGGSVARCFRRVTHLLVAMCLVVTWSMVATAQTAEELRTRAEAGDANAQYDLGRMYLRGSGVPQSPKEAERWFCLAVDQAHTGA